MSTLSATGNFFGRPNRFTTVGQRLDYHFHNFDHTAMAMAGLWFVQQFEWEEGQSKPDLGRHVGMALMGPKLFAPPGKPVVPWVLIQKNRWHTIELVSKTAYLANGVTAEVEVAEFWCCFSLRDPQGMVVDHQTGWDGAFL